MRKKSHLLMSLALVATLITGCSSTKPKVPDDPPEVLYQQARLKLDAGNYVNAIELLEALDTRYPFGAYSNQVQLDLIYAYYKQDDTAQAIASIDRFIRLNPAHKNIDYVFYIRGLTNMAADYNFFQALFGIDRQDKDPGYARQAFQDFKTLLQNYPNSMYAADARARMIGLKNRLAQYDLNVVQYYVKRDALVAAANRAAAIVETYPDTPQVETALEIMVSSYETLKMPLLAEHAREVLAKNYPDNRLNRS
ncbi:outer membrane protein assembly factor BamD [Aeromonas cavernicola]|uniref:Outer membrane protein assembly factor BamD n=1 Tax=Aeromonas cavernicola TaxID=1006623 RepID=A0A2H9U6E1_9GAMM|nr:outer membrane protein assembly factor BamD [Aeromonas cavernicola]PJG59605.1 outer membrane protein assembly factor BamD [Aeromonas cavernicola]